MSNRRKNRPTAPSPTVATVPAPKGRAWQSRIGEVMLSLAAAQDAGEIPRRPFAAPSLPPNVVPKGARFALDNASAGGMYSWLNGQPGFCGMGFPGYTYLSELSQRSEYRAPTETTANEMTREWIKFTGASDNEQKELEQAFKDFNLQACFREMATYDGFFGRGQLYIHIKGQDSDQRRKLPLIVDDGGATIQKGQLLGFKPIEPIWTTPYSYNSIDPTQPNFYKPDWWYVLGKQTHSSRLLTFVSRPLPDILKPSYNFGGMSLSQLVEPYVVRWLKTVDSVNRLISNFSLTALATNMGATLEDGGPGDSLFARARLFNQVRDNRGLMIIDKESEDILQRNTPLAGLSDLQAQAQEHMAAPTHIPLVKLTGITPAGLNANSDGEIKVWYDWVSSEQENEFDPHLQTVFKLVQLHLWGRVNPKIKAEWVPLDSPTDKDLATMRKDDASAGKAYVDSGVISADEERQRLRNDPNSGYNFLTGDAPPGPLDREHELGEESAEAAHERGEESAEAAHARQKELDKGKPKK
jgi:phage-related protein (TIGR01555 family)